MLAIEDMYIIFVVAFCAFVFPVLWFAWKRIKERLEYYKAERRRQREAAQQEDVWNISGRVNNQGATQNHPWPTHDNHVSIETIIVDPMKDMRPGYNDPPPSYEQAMSSASLRYDSLNVQAETTPTPAPSSSVATTSQQPNTPPEVVATTATRTEVSS